MVGLSKVKDIYLIRQRRITQQQTCISSHEFITRSASASTDCIISHRDVHIPLISNSIYILAVFLLLLLFFILIQRWWYALSYLSVFLLVVFRFSFFLFFVLFDLSNIRWTKTVKKPLEEPAVIYTQQQQQKALYLRESRWRSSIYIHIMCLFSECSFLSLSNLDWSHWGSWDLLDMRQLLDSVYCAHHYIDI